VGQLSSCRKGENGINMKYDIQPAVTYATTEIQGFFERGNSYKKLNEICLAEALGVYSKDYDWRYALNEASKNYEVYYGLVKYCELLGQLQKDIPEELQQWQRDCTDGKFKIPKRPQRRPRTGLENNMLLPRLVEKIAVKFNLPRTRNEASDPYSACDVVHEAIIKVPAAREIFSREFDKIKKDYQRAKRLGIFEKK